MFQYEAKVVQVIDGDTLKLMIDLGFDVHTLATVRLAHVNTPETVEYGLEGMKDPARDFIMSKIPPGAVCVVNISRKEKYGRWLAEVYYLLGSISRNEIATQGRQLNQELITAGLAVAYEGGRK